MKLLWQILAQSKKKDISAESFLYVVEAFVKSSKKKSV